MSATTAGPNDARLRTAFARTNALLSVLKPSSASRARVASESATLVRARARATCWRTNSSRCRASGSMARAPAAFLGRAMAYAAARTAWSDVSASHGVTSVAGTARSFTVARSSSARTIPLRCAAVLETSGCALPSPSASESTERETSPSSPSAHAASRATGSGAPATARPSASSDAESFPSPRANAALAATAVSGSSRSRRSVP